jgi:predicted RNA binding protein YcfA (HicA-like mRNA interferase family)
LQYEEIAQDFRPGVRSGVERLGFYFKRQEGSHIILRKDNPFAQIVVPDHKELDRGTLRAIIRQANVSVDELINAL